MGGTLGMVLAAGELRDRISHLVLNDEGSPERPRASAPPDALSILRDPPATARRPSGGVLSGKVYEPLRAPLRTRNGNPLTGSYAAASRRRTG